MTNDQIQHLLANPDPEQMRSLLSSLVMPGGAISIADEAAWELIQGECSSYADEPSDVIWYETHSNKLRLALDGEDDIFDQVSNAVSYLVARGLLISHPDRASLVSRREKP